MSDRGDRLDLDVVGCGRGGGKHCRRQGNDSARVAREAHGIRLLTIGMKS